MSQCNTQVRHILLSNNYLMLTLLSHTALGLSCTPAFGLKKLHKRRKWEDRKYQHGNIVMWKLHAVVPHISFLS